MARTSAAQARFALQRDLPRHPPSRNSIFVAARLAGVLQRVLVPMLSQTDIDYSSDDTSPIMLRNTSSGPARSGQRVAVRAARAGGRPPLDPYRFTVACWPGRRVPAGWGTIVTAHARQVAGQAAVLDLSAASGQAAARLRRAFGSRPVIAVVRPDGHLAHLAGTGSPGHVADLLARHVRTPEAGQGRAGAGDLPRTAPAHRLSPVFGPWPPSRPLAALEEMRTVP